MVTPLLLRPFELEDEEPAVAAHRSFVSDNFTFLLGYTDGMPWPDWIESRKIQAGADIPPDKVREAFLAAEVDGAVVGRVSDAKGVSIGCWSSATRATLDRRSTLSDAEVSSKASPPQTKALAFAGTGSESHSQEQGDTRPSKATSRFGRPRIRLRRLAAIWRSSADATRERHQFPRRVQQNGEH
jgi:hypothetical protein